MADQEPQQQNPLRKLSKFAAAFRIRHPPTLLQRRRSENNNNNINSNNSSNNSGQQAQPPRRRLPRGWWPDQGKRADQKLKAMYDLKDDTFVITEDHIEYVFNDNEDNDDPTAQYKINLIPPADISLRHDKQNNRCLNECSICMLEYDTGDVVVCSKYCNHVFHQECILNWFSHSNVKSGESNRSCPSCRCNFWDVEENNQTEGEEVGVNSRSRSDTADTDALSVINVEQSTSRGDSSMDNENALSPVAEN